MTAPWLGVIADDVTGACDVAGGVAAAGVPTSIYLGVPDAAEQGRDGCLVVALKTRTVDPADAVAQSTAAADWLHAQGSPLIYQKYCSTFDSTDRGNIGPVADALAPARGVTVGTPATPAAGRTQYLGHLFVGDRLLSESPMRDHPLTPMRDSDLVAVLARQSRGAVALVPLPAVRSGAAAARIEAAGRDGARHILVDAIEDADLDALAAALDDVRTPVVLGGGAGVAVALARRRSTGTSPAAAASLAPGGPRLILSGSASQRTREQVAAFAGPTVAVDPLALSRDGADPLLAEVRAAVAAAGDAPVLVSATSEPARVRAVQDELGVGAAAELLESTLARVAVLGVAQLGVRRLLVAGGETSGATAAALGLRRLAVGALAAPGVPWTTGVAAAVPGSPTVALLLKSGNFGDPDLFTTAWGSAP